MQRMPILSDSDMSLFELKTRYVRNYLTFAGKNSKDFLLSCSPYADLLKMDSFSVENVMSL